MKLGPTGTIIRKKEFDDLGQFTGTRYIGDVEMWHKIAMRFPVVKMVPGLAFWRQHDDQEISKGLDSYFYLENAYKHAIKVLGDPLIPLDEKSVLKAKRKLNKRFSRDIIRLIVVKREFATANRIRKSCNVTWVELLQWF